MLTASESSLLDRLVVGSASVPAKASASGLRLTSERGPGLEFQEFRHYQPGDDPRFIDWTVEARLGQLVVRVPRAEGHLRLHLLLDVSGSMSIGTPSKLSCATKLAAALAYVAIERRDAVAIAMFDDRIRHRLRMESGRVQLARIFERLALTAADGRSALTEVLTKYSAAARGPGLAVVFSDFFESANTLDGLRHLMHGGLMPCVVQVLAREEVDPQITDEIELTDIEDSAGPAIIVDSAAVSAYRERLTQLSDELRNFCVTHRLPFVRIESSDSFERLLQACERAALLGAYA